VVDGEMTFGNSSQDAAGDGRDDVRDDTRIEEPDVLVDQSDESEKESIAR